MIKLEGPKVGYTIEPVTEKLGQDPEFDEFVRQLCEKIQREAERRDKIFKEEWEACEDIYYAQSDWPDVHGDADMKMDYTITYQMCKSASANLTNPIFAQDTIFVADARPGYQDLAAATDEMLDFIADRSNYLTLIVDAIRHAQIYTKCVVKVGYSYKERLVNYWSIDDDGNPVEEQKVIQEEEGSTPHLVPIRYFYHPIPCADLDTAEWVAEEFEEHMQTIRAKVKSGWYRTDLEVDRLNIAQDTQERRERDEDEEVFRAHSISPPEHREPDGGVRPPILMEVYTTWRGREVILIIDRPGKTWLRATYNWFHDYQRPYFTFSWEQITHSIDGRSLCSIIEPLHRAFRAIMNILCDSGTRNIEPLVVALKELKLSKTMKNGRVGPGLVEVDQKIADMVEKGIKVIDLKSGDLGFLVQLLDKIELLMRDTANTPEAFQGREVAERPTAYGTGAVMDKAMQPLYVLMERFRVFLVKLISAQYSRYRQFYPKAFKFYVQESADAALLEKVIQFPAGFWKDQIVLETKVNSQTMSKAIKKQEALAMVDKLPAIFQSYLEITNAATSGSPVAVAAGQALDAYAKVIGQWLTEFDLPQVKESFNVDAAKLVGEGIQQALQAYQQQITDLTNQVTTLQSQITDLGGGKPPAGPAGGQPSGPPAAQAAA